MLSKRPVTYALAFLVLAFGCKEDPVLPDPDPDPDPDPVEEGFDFVYDPPAGAPNITSVVLRGEFNQWGPPNGTDVVMEEQTDGSWVGNVDLDSTTTYQYKFVINGEWIPNMCSDATWGHASAGGLVHLEADGCMDDGVGGMNAFINLSEEPGLSFTHSASDPAHVSIAGGRLSVRFHARRDMIASARLAMGTDTTDMHVQHEVSLNEVWRASTTTTSGSYSILLETTQGDTTFGPYSVPADPFTMVPWVGDAVAYQIFPDRFWNGDPSNDSLALGSDEYDYNVLWTSNGPTVAASWDTPPSNNHCCHQYYGGDLAGILEKLPHLQSLGVTVIYLNPIWHSGSAHGYDAFDYLTLAPEFGDAAMLRTFVDQVHAAGMRIIWDFVPNHVGLGFWAFQDVYEASLAGETSVYEDWFFMHPDADGFQPGDGDDYDGWWGIGSLPELRTTNTEVFDYLVGVAEHWTDYGFDGIRVDVPSELDNASTFFSAMRDAVKAVDPEVYLVGEIWERDPSWLQGNRFDALMNYAIGRDVIRNYVVGDINAAAAWSGMAQLYAAYPEAATGMMFNLISSHDTHRLLTWVGAGDLGGTADADDRARQRLASAILHAIPGMPVTYYGDECAMLGSADGSIHRARRTMRWDACDADMLAHYTLLAELKKTVPALATSAIREYPAAGGMLAFYRGEPGTGELLAVFNSGSGSGTMSLPAGNWSDAVSADVLSGSVQVPAYGWRYLERS